ncbi:hypothetical protein PFICI_04955 [Pestalotiopsis fici W106-1]|uniref:Uncharacterized protein n=1 Tax=Pestalotiopsis fici (strain W106-1 / CGMCC3.15140) TaxID=1229662 RepID=W3XAL4_PESFW|nr:uncharacterized protein PFICI_04955 [Pestalotiopsis fici W106-1]ETS83079.1 hypothetical protein PFICI_04955 [Pestalotiopsis fici W106-1]
MLATSMILVRILVGKVKNREWLESILRSIPIREDQTGWNCVSWVQEAVESLAVDNRALGTAVTDWETVRDTLLWYVQQKAAEHRFDGKAEPDSFDRLKVATYDLVDAKAETVP